ncbi:hypothetical protein ACTGUR_06335 [Streptococcus suis]|uniref:hypothetical protein n=1 Tax=Streptococcus suis TaxID=1307 RepID=UPI0004A78AB1|nr:hypothetical protein [Streptococcus suis]MBY4989941.1 hypothetical protein [Streptococcus suis]NQJ48542.1 hypothetical protein [Streptococcus suis]NQJ55010.1 hypothetical protein [Streptococcus suis]HEM3198280.1 hypothetical protein [Streptococcus suis 14A]HEM4387479.1 hypothetical protein [Streptococcus suis]
MKSYKQNRGEKMYFQKTEYLLNKIKLYKEVNYFEQDFYSQLQLIRELQSKPGLDYQNYLELENLHTEIHKKFILDQKFRGSQANTLSDEVYKILFEQYNIENAKSNKKQSELRTLIYQKQKELTTLQESIEKLEDSLKHLAIQQSNVLSNVVQGLTIEDFNRLEKQGIILE